MANHSLLEVNNLTVSFKQNKSIVDAVENISFKINQGKTLAIVGESGCGKSLTSLAVIGLLPEFAHKETGKYLDQKM